MSDTCNINKVVDKWLRGVSDMLYPVYCLGCGVGGTWLCSTCSDSVAICSSTSCLVCNRPAIRGYTHPQCRSRYVPERLFAPLKFSGVARSLIKALKYRRHTSVVPVLVDLLLNCMQEEDISFGTEAVLVPVPIDWRRRFSRGFNQTALLTKALSERLEIKYCPKFLYRQSGSSSQTALGRKKRQDNVRGKFTVPHHRRAALLNLDIVLVDDVVTTGATLLEAGRVLKRAGARHVWCVAFACQPL